jgi:hypothetical protein
MGNTRIAPLCMMVAVSIATATVAGDTDWTDAGTRRGITLAYRDDPSLSAREVRATADLPFSAKRIYSVVCDLAQYKVIVPGVQETKMLGGALPADYEIYLRYAPRFLVVEARDVVLRVQGAPRETAGFGCQWSELAERMPPQKGVVRMPLLRGSWTIDSLDASRSRVVYQVMARPGGRLPGWLVRRGSVNALPEVIEQVRRCLERESRKAPDGPFSCRE